MSHCVKGLNLGAHILAEYLFLKKKKTLEYLDIKPDYYIKHGSSPEKQIKESLDSVFSFRGSESTLLCGGCRVQHCLWSFVLP